MNFFDLEWKQFSLLCDALSYMKNDNEKCSVLPTFDFDLTWRSGLFFPYGWVVLNLIWVGLIDMDAVPWILVGLLGLDD